MIAQLINARDLGTALGISCQTVIRLQKSGAIPAEIAEGSTYRFDEEKVRMILRHRAAKRVEEELKPRRPLSYFGPRHEVYEPAPPEPSVYMLEHNARLKKERLAQQLASRKERDK
ncbi:MAG: hypothetical protein V4689_05885 [Verrucomicrobiota bacterium]